MPTGQLVIGFNPSITNTILTMWIVMAAAARRLSWPPAGMRDVPGRLQNVVEWAYETLDGFARRPRAARRRPGTSRSSPRSSSSSCSATGAASCRRSARIEELRAPTSDLNITIGLALVAFAYFEFQGVPGARRRGYLGKFFPVREFRNGIGAGLIAMFVGLIELMLEFVKPVTLAMRLFGNIYGGEVALGVLIALTIAILPVAMSGSSSCSTSSRRSSSAFSPSCSRSSRSETHHEEDETARAALAIARSPGQHLATSPAH